MFSDCQGDLTKCCVCVQPPRPLVQRRRSSRSLRQPRRSPDGAEGDQSLHELRAHNSAPSSPSVSNPGKFPIAKIAATVAAAPAPALRSSPNTPAKVKRCVSDSRQLPSSLPSPTKQNSSTAVSTLAGSGSPVLVRQGTFNLDQAEAFIDKSLMGDAGEGDPLGTNGWLVQEDNTAEAGGGRDALVATLAAHMARVEQINTLKTE